MLINFNGCQPCSVETPLGHLKVSLDSTFELTCPFSAPYLSYLNEPLWSFYACIADWYTSLFDRRWCACQVKIYCYILILLNILCVYLPDQSASRKPGMSSFKNSKFSIYCNLINVTGVRWSSFIFKTQCFTVFQIERSVVVAYF